MLDKAVSLVNNKYLQKTPLPKSRLSIVSYPRPNDYWGLSERTSENVYNFIELVMDIVDINKKVDEYIDAEYVKIVKNIKPIRPAPSLPINIPRKKD